MVHKHEERSPLYSFHKTSFLMVHKREERSPLYFFHKTSFLMVHKHEEYSPLYFFHKTSVWYTNAKSALLFISFIRHWYGTQTRKSTLLFIPFIRHRYGTQTRRALSSQSFRLYSLQRNIIPCNCLREASPNYYRVYRACHCAQLLLLVCIDHRKPPKPGSGFESSRVRGLCDGVTETALVTVGDEGYLS
jgi:hypothetical protein